jgi:hypothetical protein
MVGFRDLVGTGIAPVSKKTAVKLFLYIVLVNFLAISAVGSSYQTSHVITQGHQWWMGKVGNCPPRFWQNRRRRWAVATRRITTCPPIFE